MTKNQESFDALAEIDKLARRGQMEEEAAKKFSQARIDLLLSRTATGVYFATVAMRLGVEPSWAIDTAATDGKRIRYNPEFVCGLSRGQCVFLIKHEVMHVTNAHHARQGDRDLSQWNVACDLAINPFLNEPGEEKIEAALFPGVGPYSAIASGLSAEEIYSQLQNQNQKPKEEDGDQDDEDETGDDQAAGDDQADDQDQDDQDGDEESDDQDGDADSDEDGDEDDADGSGAGDQDDDEGDAEGSGEGAGDPDPGQCGGIEKPGQGSPAECAQAEAEAREMAAAAVAAVQASGRGDLPAGIAQQIDKMIQPKTDWKAVLREFVSRHARNDFSWVRPDRRFIQQGLYLPGMYSDELGEVAACIDASGSTLGYLSKFCAELTDALSAYDCTATVRVHDVDVHTVQEWTSIDGPIEVEIKGGGGTSHLPVFDEIAKGEKIPTCIICFTDMDTRFPADPGIPTLWVSTVKGVRAPFGQVVEMEM